MMGFNQETFSNIQTIKAFDLIPLYVRQLKQFQKDFWNLKKKYQRAALSLLRDCILERSVLDIIKLTGIPAIANSANTGS